MFWPSRRKMIKNKEKKEWCLSYKRPILLYSTTSDVLCLQLLLSEVIIFYMMFIIFYYVLCFLKCLNYRYILNIHSVCIVKTLSQTICAYRHSYKIKYCYIIKAYFCRYFKVFHWKNTADIPDIIVRENLIKSIKKKSLNYFYNR